MIKKNAFEITMSIMILAIGFLIGRGVGHRAADRWWEGRGTTSYRVTIPIIVRGKTMTGVTVPVDGFSYEECEFHDVTLDYEGTSQFALIGNIFYGHTLVTSRNKSLLSAMNLAVKLVNDTKYIKQDSTPYSTIALNLVEQTTAPPKPH